MSVNSKMTAIADAIRLKTGGTETLTLDEMASSLNNIPTQAAKTITPGTSSQVAIASKTYATGSVTVKGDANLKAENIIDGVSIFGVSGTYVGGNTDIEDMIISRTLVSYSNDRHTYIGSYAFASCSKLKSVNFPKCATIEDYAFFTCRQLTDINFPACTNIGTSAFDHCVDLTAIDFPACSIVSNNAFNFCLSLTTASFPLCQTIGSKAFYSCKLNSVAHFPVCTTINNSAFCYCRFTTINFPACTTIGTYAFQYCRSLTTASFPNCVNINAAAFSGCTNLSSLYLPGSSICTLKNSTAFYGTGIKSSTGAIYVPLSLGWSYKNATNWTYFSNRIFSIEGEEIVEPPISFTIDGIAYKATIGNTWSDWIISDYNTADFKINGAAIVSADGSVQISGVIASDLIEENYDYETRAIGAFGDPITFYIRSDQYTALDGMNWADWANSEYNSSDDYSGWGAISVDMENNVVRCGDMGEIIVNEDWEAVTPHDLIIVNMQYEVGIGDFDDL